MSRTTRRLAALAASAAAVAATVVGVPAPAQAAPVTFENCPAYSDQCFKAVTTGGSFTIGPLTIPLTGAITLTGGMSGSDEVSPLEEPKLSAAALQVPGGLLGLAGTERLLSGITDIKATTQLAGTPKVNIYDVLYGEGPGLVLPVKIKLSNALLGPSCMIGSDANPIELRLTTGQTAPPPPNQPIAGDRGTLTFEPESGAVVAEGSRLVDNGFAVPAAKGCSALGLKLLNLDGVVNGRQKLPSPAGSNTAVFESEAAFGPNPAA